MVDNPHNPANQNALASPAKSLDALLRYGDIQFVESAFLTLLQRSADEAGLNHYTKRLLSGTSKLAILREISTSAEGRLADIELAGLRRAVRLEQLGRIPLVGFLLAPLIKEDGAWFLEDEMSAIFRRKKPTVSAEELLEQLPPRALEIHQLLKDAEARRLRSR